MTSVLDRIADPTDLRRLDRDELTTLAAELRRTLIDTVCRTGGHLGPNLGVVELSIALHRVFRSPRDPILWDTGHQAYVHKLLTGRGPGFDRLRKSGGPSGYPNPAESEHDLVENSHASTALSYADGLAKAYELRGERGRTVVAVVGDGALTGGMCWEALNNLGAARDRPVVVVLNDNGRSYDPTVGGLARHLGALRTGTAGAGRIPNLFEGLGLAYLGPVDGHDVPAVEAALRQAQALRRPVVVHVVTRKGMGYRPAEDNDADRLHAVGVVDPATGTPSTQPPPTWTQVFGEEVTALGAQRADLVAVTAAMLEPVGLRPFQRAYPHRVFDVGIAEQHAVTSAAGLALGGLHPVVAVYATFLNRAFDQVLMDVALHRLPVTFVLDRAGVTGDDGPSHNGMWDLPMLGIVPGLRIGAPRDAATLRSLLREAVDINGPTVLRFPKAPMGEPVPALETHEGVEILARGQRVLIVSVGAMAETCLAVAARLGAAGVTATVVDPRWVLPVNPALAQLAAAHRLVVTVEDGARSGGVGSAIAQALADRRGTTPVHTFGLPAEFLPHGTRSDVLRSRGLAADAIADAILDQVDDAGEPLAGDRFGQPVGTYLRTARVTGASSRPARQFAGRTG
jgi:1-deoxy-D-xylulose-5-phosphate synthase